ncbi:MAG: hypothetical protein ABI859_14805 [Pseudomonadota bacterium]
MRHRRQARFLFDAAVSAAMPALLPAPPLLSTAVTGAAPVAAPSRELWAAVQWPRVTDAPPPDLTTLALRGFKFTPRVSLEPPDALLLELRGSLALFGGLAALLGALQAQFAMAESIALAPTPLAALALARAGKSCCIVDATRLGSRLAALPLQCLRWPDEAIARLCSMGVRTIGAALRLPRAGFARRFGPALLDSLDRLVARRADPRTTFRAPERVRLHCEPDFELTSQDAVMRSIAPLLTTLEHFLRERQCGISALLLRLSHRDWPATRCVLRLAHPESAAPQFASLLEAQLQRIVLPAPVRRCELRSGPLLTDARYSSALWKPGEQGGGASAQMPAFLDRLRARLGDQAVHGLCVVPEHRPERLVRKSEPHMLQSAHRLPECPPWAAGRRPLWLLPQPQPLTLLHDSVSTRVSLSYQGERLTLQSGPERLETGWWDAGGIGRDYYVAQDAGGARLWIFREIEPPQRWFLHGIFC